MARKKISMMGQYLADDIEETARIWCNKNSIRIYPKPTIMGSPNKWFLILEINTKIVQAPDELHRVDVWKKMYEYYMYYYLKYNKK